MGLTTAVVISRLPTGAERTPSWVKTPPNVEGKYLVRNQMGRERMVTAARYPEIDMRLRVDGPYGMLPVDSTKLKKCQWLAISDD